MSDLLVERDGHVMILTMNRPHRYNALSAEMVCKMYDSWVEASESDDIRCVILTGAEGNFCSGMDLKELSGGRPDNEYKRRLDADPDINLKGLLWGYRCKKPVIAAVEGNAIAGGTEILQGTDIRVAGESAKFGVAEVRWSLFPAGGSAVRLPRQIPYTKAAEILLTGKHFSAQEAEHLGLIGHVVPDGQALAKAKEIAAVIADNGPIAVEAVLKVIHESAGMTEEEAFGFSNKIGFPVFMTEDAKEGPLAFSQKRKPQFKRR